jgi:hypothetical protein
MVKHIRALVIACVLVILAAGVAGADGVAYTVGILLGPEAELQRVSLGSGAATPVGVLGFQVTGLAFDAAGTLFGVDASTDHLVVIDRATGVASAVGPLGVDVLDVRGLTFDHEGCLWMVALVEETGASLFEIDPASGSTLLVAGIPAEYLGALASLGETVYMAASTLVVVDTSTGAVQPVAGSDLGSWWARALDRGSRDDLRGLMLCTTCETPFEVLQLQGVDPVTGNAVETGPYLTPSTWGLAIVPGSLFYDGFESGDAAGWTGATE